MTATVLLTRPADQSARFADALHERLGAAVPVVIAPVMRIVPDPDAAARALRGAGGAIFTSENGVAACSEAAVPHGLPAFCVGPRTAEAAAARGFAVRSGPGDAAGLAATIAEAGWPTGAPPLVHLHGAHVTGDLAGALAAAGIAARGMVVYDQRATPLGQDALALLAGRRAVVVPLFSPRSARLVAPQLVRARAPLRIAAISPAVATALNVHSAAKPQVQVAASPDAEAMLEAVARLWENGSFLER
jgi:uroporphyrinogen-III synthase